MKLISQENIKTGVQSYFSGNKHFPNTVTNKNGLVLKIRQKDMKLQSYVIDQSGQCDNYLQCIHELDICTSYTIEENIKAFCEIIKAGEI